MAKFSLRVRRRKIEATRGSVGNQFKESLLRSFIDGMDLTTDVVLDEFRKATPRDTGYARSRWVKTKGRDGKTYLITNDTPYIIYLENGHSGQAPLGITHLATQMLRARGIIP